MIVKIDTREQLELPFKVGGSISKILRVGLPFGDYWCSWQDKNGNELNEMPVVFERKSMNDLFGTLMNKENHVRFKKEIQRAKDAQCKLILIIEGSLSKVYEGNTGSMADPQALVKQLFTLWMKYDLLSVFCTTREEMVCYMIETWESIGRNFKSEVLTP